jgi:hypothetical protein
MVGTEFSLIYKIAPQSLFCVNQNSLHNEKFDDDWPVDSRMRNRLWSKSKE